jgi:hypothetical protein
MAEILMNTELTELTVQHLATLKVVEVPRETQPSKSPRTHPFPNKRHLDNHCASG